MIFIDFEFSMPEGRGHKGFFPEIIEVGLLAVQGGWAAPGPLALGLQAPLSAKALSGLQVRGLVSTKEYYNLVVAHSFLFSPIF